MAWAEFLLAFLAFFASHALPVQPRWKSAFQILLGARGFTLAYSALSLGVLAWLIAAAGRASSVALWDWAPWQTHAALLAMLPACLILALAIGRPNPFSFGGAHNDQFDPQRPGIVRWTRHPLLLALAIWAGIHLLPNGDLAHVTLFGSFALFAAFGGRLIDRRKRHTMGTEWVTLQQELARTRWTALRPNGNTFIRIAAGVLLYAALLWLHPVLFGVNPLAGA